MRMRTHNTRTHGADSVKDENIGHTTAKLSVKLKQLPWEMIRLFFFFLFFFSLAPENCTNGNLEYTPHHLYSYMRGQKKDKRQRHGDVSYLQPIKNTWFLAGLNAVPCDNLLLFFFCALLPRVFPKEPLCGVQSSKAKDQNEALISHTHTHTSLTSTHTHTHSFRVWV